MKVAQPLLLSCLISSLVACGGGGGSSSDSSSSSNSSNSNSSNSNSSSSVSTGTTGSTSSKKVDAIDFMSLSSSGLVKQTIEQRLTGSSLDIQPSSFLFAHTSTTYWTYESINDDVTQTDCYGGEDTLPSEIFREYVTEKELKDSYANEMIYCSNTDVTIFQKDSGYEVQYKCEDFLAKTEYYDVISSTPAFNLGSASFAFPDNAQTVENSVCPQNNYVKIRDAEELDIEDTSYDIYAFNVFEEDGSARTVIISSANKLTAGTYSFSPHAESFDSQGNILENKVVLNVSYIGLTTTTFNTDAQSGTLVIESVDGKHIRGNFTATMSEGFDGLFTGSFDINFNGN